MKSPFFRPLCVAMAVIAVYLIEGEMGRRQITGQKALLIGSWFLLGAALVGFGQIVLKRELGWVGSFVAVLVGGIVVGLLALGLQRLGLIYQRP